jgi:hypothetical protein
MKNVKVFLVALVLFVGTLSSYAAVDPIVKTKTTSEEIAALLENPGFTVEDEINATVTFVLNKNNEIVVLSIDCNNLSVNSFIKNRLNYKEIKAQLVKGKEYNIPIRIRGEA